MAVTTVYKELQKCASNGNEDGNPFLSDKVVNRSRQSTPRRKDTYRHTQVPKTPTKEGQEKIRK
jgi:hypothetical protein